MNAIGLVALGLYVAAEASVTGTMTSGDASPAASDQPETEIPAGMNGPVPESRRPSSADLLVQDLLDELRFLHEEIGLLEQRKRLALEAIAKADDPAARKMLDHRLSRLDVERSHIEANEARAAGNLGSLTAVCVIDLPKEALAGISASALTVYRASASSLARNDLVTNVRKWGVSRKRADAMARLAKEAGKNPAWRYAWLTIGIGAGLVAFYDERAEAALEKAMADRAGLEKALKSFCES